MALLCLIFGGFLIVEFYLSQFRKLSISSDMNDPWKFLVTRYLTPRPQYLIGFAIYCGAMLSIFLVVSLFPGRHPGRPQGGHFGGHGRYPEPAGCALRNHSAELSDLPLVVAFAIVEINPILPKALDFEIFIRRLGHRIRYIPKNVDRIFQLRAIFGVRFIRPKASTPGKRADLRRMPLDPDLEGSGAGDQSGGDAVCARGHARGRHHTGWRDRPAAKRQSGSVQAISR